MMQKKDCAGCYEDFYNYQSPTGCWVFDASKPLKVRFYIHRDSPMGDRRNYEKRTVPPCWHPQIGVMVDKIPEYAK